MPRTTARVRTRRVVTAPEPWPLPQMSDSRRFLRYQSAQGSIEISVAVTLRVTGHVLVATMAHTGGSGPAQCSHASPLERSGSSHEHK